MRVVRVGDEGAAVGVDLRAALTSWGRGDGIAGGVALMGVQPPDCPLRLEALVVLPRGVVVVVGVDLPDPAVTLDAPLAGQWTTDGWPLVRPDGALNPAAEALLAADAVRARLEVRQAPTVPVGLVVAVGPFVSRVTQPTGDLVRGVRVLHPEPTPLLTACRELTTHPRSTAVREARHILAALHPDVIDVSDDDLRAEGFAATAPPAAEDTAVIARRRKPAQARTDAPPRPTLRWLPVAAALVVVALLVTGIAVAIGTADGPPEPEPTKTRSSGNLVDGVSFAARGVTADPGCAQHTYGDVRAWLDRNACLRIIRARYEAQKDDRRAAVQVAVLRFPTGAAATELRAVADRPGAGWVTDDQTTPWPTPTQPTFASATVITGREGNSLKLVQAVWFDSPSTPDDPALRGIAERALQLTTTG